MKYAIYCALCLFIGLVSCKNEGKVETTDNQETQTKKKRLAQDIDSTPYMKEYARKHREREQKKEAKRKGANVDLSSTASDKKSHPKSTGAGSLSKVDVVSMPSSDLYLPEIPNILTVSDVSKAFGLEVDKVSLEGSSHEPGSRLSRGAWTWYDDKNTFRRFTVNLNTNPLPGELTTWEDQSMGNLLSKGLSFNDGSAISFEEVQHKGRRYAWSEEAHILKWFYNGDYTFNIAGIGAAYGDKKSFLSLADKLNTGLEQGINN